MCIRAFQDSAVSTPVKEGVHAQFFFAGRLLDYKGPFAPEGFMLPEGMEIVRWDHPSLFWLKHEKKLIAGPARCEVLESFVNTMTADVEEHGERILEEGDQQQS